MKLDLLKEAQEIFKKIYDKSKRATIEDYISYVILGLISSSGSCGYYSDRVYIMLSLDSLGFNHKNDDDVKFVNELREALKKEGFSIGDLKIIKGHDSNVDEYYFYVGYDYKLVANN